MPPRYKGKFSCMHLDTSCQLPTVFAGPVGVAAREGRAVRSDRAQELPHVGLSPRPQDGPGDEDQGAALRGSISTPC